MYLFERAKALFSKLRDKYGGVKSTAIMVQEIALPEKLPIKITKGAFGGPRPAGSKLAKRFAEGATKGPRGY